MFLALFTKLLIHFFFSPDTDPVIAQSSLFRGASFFRD